MEREQGSVAFLCYVPMPPTRQALPQAQISPLFVPQHFVHNFISIIFAIIFFSLDFQYPGLIYYHISLVLYNPFFIWIFSQFSLLIESVSKNSPSKKQLDYNLRRSPVSSHPIPLPATSQSESPITLNLGCIPLLSFLWGFSTCLSHHGFFFP